MNNQNKHHDYLAFPIFFKVLGSKKVTSTITTAKSLKRLSKKIKTKQFM